MTKTLVFTDMDGTLLDHHTYSFDAAKPALNALDEKNIPVIPTTSKTFAELQPLRKSIASTVHLLLKMGQRFSYHMAFLSKNPLALYG